MSFYVQTRYFRPQIDLPPCHQLIQARGAQRIIGRLQSGTGGKFENNKYGRITQESYRACVEGPANSELSL